MAEYIERDIAIRTAIETCIKAVGHGITQFDAAEIATAFEDIPTADVVPKSEVDDLKRYIILNEDIAIKCKQENGEQNEEYWKGKISAFRQIRAYIDAELKKKYTESENG